MHNSALRGRTSTATAAIPATTCCAAISSTSSGLRLNKSGWHAVNWGSLPFLLLAAYVGFRQMRTVSPGQVDDRLAALRDMHWDQFSVLIADAYRKQGYTVEAADKSAYDFTLTQGSRVTLLQCRRWKVNQLGVGPLEELARAVSAAEAHNGICIAAGNVSPKAKEFVIEKPLALVTGIELAGLVGKLNKTHA